MANVVQAEWVFVADEGQQVVDPAANVGLAHAEVHLFVEQREHGQRVGHPAVDADHRDGSATADDFDGGLQRGEPIGPDAGHQLLGEAVGDQPDHLVAQLGQR